MRQLSTAGRTGSTIHRGRFDRVICDYEPLAFEVVQSTDWRRFRLPMHHALKNRDRLWLAIEAAAPYFALGPFTGEHLVSPSHLFAKAFHICAPGGYLLVTTPNVTIIGSVFKLLIGRSNFDRLIPPDYENPEDEWRSHSREFTMAEVSDFFQRGGFEMVERHHAVVDNTHYNVKSMAQRLIDLTKLPCYMVPHFRGTLLVVGRKPTHQRGGDQ